MNPTAYLEALKAKYPGTKTDLSALNVLLRGYTVRAVDRLVSETFRCQSEHGFDATPAEDIALMHSELSEALEDIRDKKWGLAFGDPEKPLKPTGVASELADVLIRVLAFAGKHNIDLADAVVRKILYNETRPFRHGGKIL